MPINSLEVRIDMNYKFNLRLSNFIINSSILNTYSPYTLFLNFYLQSTLNCSVTSSGHAYSQLGKTLKPRGKYLCGVYLVKTFAGMLQVYTGYLPTVRDWSMHFLTGN